MRDLLMAVFPPDVPAVMKWRLSVFVALFLAGVHVAWACGWLASIGLGSGFAYAGDVAKVTVEVSSVKTELIEWQIWDARVRQCEAVKAGERSGPYGQRVSALLTKYQQLTGQAFPLLSCAEQ